MGIGKKKTDEKNSKESRDGDPLATPVMRQYLEIKEKFKNAILLFRMGDFYELFLEDAQIAAPIMEVTLTARQGGVPMAGVPYHSADSYIARLMAAGKRVAIAEQEADPANPKLMRRVVKRVITPGTIVEESILKSGQHNYLMALHWNEPVMGVALADVSTGDFHSFEFSRDEELSLEEWQLYLLRTLLSRYAPGEILLSSAMGEKMRELFPDQAYLFVDLPPYRSSPSEGARSIQRLFQVSLKGLGYESDASPALGAVALILHYVSESFPESGCNLEVPALLKPRSDTMLLEEQTIRNLDLIANFSEGGSDRTLFRILDSCRTTPGKRFLKDAILSPLLNTTAIQARLNSVELLIQNRSLLEELTSHLSQISDLERILSRMTTGRASPRDLLAISTTIRSSITMQKLLSARTMSGKSEETDQGNNASQNALSMSDRKQLQQMMQELDANVVEDPPAQLGAFPFVRQGVDASLDRAHNARDEGGKWIVKFESDERKRTGIGNLKVKYNKIVGYFIEVSKGQLGSVPADYRRRQTLVGNERYTCDRLEELERSILGAEETIEEKESQIFRDLCQKVLNEQKSIRELMKDLSRIDFLASLARCAIHYRWSRPRFSDKATLVIEDGRHPVVEAYLPASEKFIPNDVVMDDDKRRFAILTGPNMAGKSTYIRQVALIQILAQIGSFVPAKNAILSMADNIFTRIGAGDNLTRGESTFFVEMLETARILHRATSRSLIIMDEVGRGTSTFDGLSIAWAVVEHLTDGEISPRTLFATHYHELTALESRSGVFNLTMDVQETMGKVLFLRKVKEGAADESYGIHVARLAGLPARVIERAEEKLKELEEEMGRMRARPSPGPGRKKNRTSMEEQPPLFH